MGIRKPSYTVGGKVDWCSHYGKQYQFNSVTYSCPTLCHPWTATRQASLSITNFQSLLKLMSIELMMLSNHLNLCHPLFLLP